MAAGDLITADYQYEFRNLLFGAQTDLITERVTGLLAMGARDTDQDRQNDHGSFPGMMVMGKRIIQFDMKVTGSPGTDIEGRLALVRSVFQVPRKRYARVLEPFVFQRPGLGKRVLYVRCTKRDFVSEYSTARGVASGSVELVAPDPLIYSLAVHQEALTIASGATTTSEVLVNTGDFVDGFLPKFTITGPATNPRVGNAQDDNRQVRTSMVLGATDTLVIDTKTKVVTVNGVRQFGVIRNDNQWWALLPGNNTVSYSRDAGNTGASSTCTVTWQDVWQ